MKCPAIRLNLEMNKLRSIQKLLESFWIIKSRDKDMYFLARAEMNSIEKFAREYPGWRVVSNERIIKLEKVPSYAQSFMGITEFRSKLDYMILCSLLIFLEDKEDFDLHLASIEKIILLKELLENKRKIISISKTSSDTELFEWKIPDIAILDKFTEKQGLSKIEYRRVFKNAPFPFYNDFFKRLQFTVFYVRLQDNKNVLKVELPYKASVGEVIRIIEKINKLSVQGYPYLLSKAHNDVVITDRNIKELLKIAKIYETTNREML